MQPTDPSLTPLPQSDATMPPVVEPNAAPAQNTAPLMEQATAPVLEQTTIPVIEETARIEKRLVETGRVVISKTVHHDTQTVNVPVQEEHVHVERVAINQVVETPPDVRHEGDIMIIPVLREEVVVTTRLVLVEELHVRKRTLTLSHPQEVTVRREEVHYERIETPPPAEPAS